MDTDKPRVRENSFALTTVVIVMGGSPNQIRAFYFVCHSSNRIEPNPWRFLSTLFVLGLSEAISFISTITYPSYFVS